MTSAEPRADGPRLRSLRPRYVEAEHGLYVSLLANDIAGESPSQNIAVSGAYGSGKSSVLEGLLVELERRSVEAIQVSLATLNQSREALLEVSGEATLTAALEKEVVKRLLYSAKPSQIPRSRFNRIGSFRPWPAVGLAAVASTLVTGMAQTFGVSLPLDQFADARDWAAWTGPALDLLSVGALAFGGQAALSSFRLSQIAVGPATLSLDDKDGNYFDHFLDEIIYFFQRTRVRVVLFEDLDRFNDPGIFLALRELNNLLNSSKQVDQRVTFVHATRDSLFVRAAEGDDAEHDTLPDRHARHGSDSAASDRAKFFDLVVPIVPFISHEVAADLLLTALKDLPANLVPSRGLVALAGRHFTDMRVILSIRNEFEVFASELLAKSAVEGLSVDQMFAAVLYKHLHLDDFERIRTGASLLDNAIDRIRTGVASSVTKLDEEIAGVEDAIESSLAIEKRSAAASARLLGRLDASLKMFGGGQVQSITVAGSTATARDAIGTTAFWQALGAAAEKKLTVQSNQGTREIAGADLDTFLGTDRDPKTWTRNELQRDRRKLAQLRAARSWLRAASIAELVGGPFPAVPADSSHEWSVLGADCRSIFDDALTFELIRGGYLDQNFALYTTKFHGAILSADARSYMMQYVDRHRSDPLFKLSSVDAQEIIARLGDAFLSDESALNVAVVDSLIETGAARLPALLETAGQAVDFLLTYLTNGKFADSLLQRLAPARADILDVICSAETLSEASRRGHLSTCLSTLSEDIDYSVSPATARVLASELDSLPFLSESLDPAASSAVRELLATNSLSVADLSKVAEPLRSDLVEGGCFAVTRHNLENVTANAEAIGLDTIGGLADGVGHHLLTSSFDEYLAAIAEDPAASIVDLSENLDSVVRAVADHAPDDLGAALASVRGGAKYGDISQAPEAVYSELAGAGLVTLTRTNISHYISVVGEIDDALATQLNQTRAVAVSEVDAGETEEESARHDLATAIATCSHLGTEVKLDLVVSLKTRTTLDVSALRLSDPGLARGLLSASEISDDAETFEALVAAPWPVFEAAATVSKAFDGLVAQLPLTDGLLAKLLASDQIQESAKRAVVAAFETFQPALGPASAGAWLSASEKLGLRLTASQAVALAQAGASGSQILDYIYSERARLSAIDMVALLAFAPTPYSSLATANGANLTLAGGDGLRGVLQALKAAGTVTEFRKKMLQDQFDVHMAG